MENRHFCGWGVMDRSPMFERPVCCLHGVRVKRIAVQEPFGFEEIQVICELIP